MPNPRPRRRVLATPLAVLLATLGCAARIAIAPESADHPASPQAPAGAVPVPAEPLAPDRLDRAVGAATTRPAPSPGPVYTCPMHPEVHADEAVTCPRCGMALVLEMEER